MGNESEDFQDVVNMTGYPRVCKAALDAQTLAELEFAMDRWIRRSLTPRSIYSPSCRRKNRFSALVDRLDRNESAHQRNISPTNWIRIAETFGMDESCHALKGKVRDSLIVRCSN